MRIVALLTVRNEALYMQRCLEHLRDQGIEACVIDNDSTDDTRAIAEAFIGNGVLRIERAPYPGHMDWVGILNQKQRLAVELDADWFLHHDADEIREAPQPYRSLRDGIEHVDALGYNAINFDEFVFVPHDLTTSFDGGDYVREMRYYYHFAPRAEHRVNAWKKQSGGVDLVSSAGHRAEFAGRNLFPRNFILRHYIVLSAHHANRKYGVERVYSQRETDERGWRPARLQWRHGKFRPPAVQDMKCIDRDGLGIDDPRRAHLFSFVTPS
jgi:glycosyltransferase involved in cell wall biosynthesis